VDLGNGPRIDFGGGFVQGSGDSISVLTPWE
jgi:hypothetical protein